MDQRKTALLFKAVGDENRIQILGLLTGGEKCACRLCPEGILQARDFLKALTPAESADERTWCPGS